MERQQIINFGISTGKYATFISHILSLAKQRASSNVCVANVHMFIEAYHDKNFIEIINAADVVTPDGIPLAWSLRLLHGIKQDRVAGMDLLPDLLQQLRLQNLPVYFYGGSVNLLQKTEIYINEKYPGLRVAGVYSPPFRQLTLDEVDDVVKRINHSGACVVFVVLGCPKQEKWMAQMKGRINAVMIGIGGALPVMVGVQKRAPKWMQRSGLEWAFRLAQEPGRLFKRYAITNSLFIYLMFKEYINTRILKKAL
jgi:N-acetylglucosaminyldiphosphoundecaprenol N-acetyl-beta-D-mannosaminyltransferase